MTRTALRSTRTSCSRPNPNIEAPQVLKYACAQLGKPYVVGGAGPNSFDCSGLTMMAYKQVGMNLNHWVPDQYDVSRHISKSQLQPGDLVFFHSLGHLGLYIGNGKFLQAPHTGDVVKVSSLSEAWYTRRTTPPTTDRDLPPAGRSPILGRPE
ncbi:C40 family peptidase [Actinomadura sp. DC4]|uniref:C40 family peptidase n=1 Tax=Actinomadura sp. DC4 TaxID=3055069 RepID=UPI0025B1C599|nr:C40 family peptidase [Actinomadura sp. DC4]MDN3354166.1 C40 family peptidase [Actinomadura sp. DC4]